MTGAIRLALPEQVGFRRSKGLLMVREILQLQVQAGNEVSQHSISLIGTMLSVMRQEEPPPAQYQTHIVRN